MTHRRPMPELTCSVNTGQIGSVFYWTVLGPLGSLVGTSAGNFATRELAQAAGERWLRNHDRRRQ